MYSFLLLVLSILLGSETDIALLNVFYFLIYLHWCIVLNQISVFIPIYTVYGLVFWPWCEGFWLGYLSKFMWAIFVTLLVTRIEI